MKSIDDDAEPFAESHGIVVGPLRARLPDRITIGETVVFLTSDTRCDYAIGTVLRNITG
jgi:hypothetical protein